MTLDEYDGVISLTFDCGRLPADPAVVAAGHTPNGYFWAGVAQYAAPGLASQIELDCEAGMFCAYGDRPHLAQLREALSPYLEDPARTARLIAEATASRFQFDD